jgi:hypothetical protein
MVPGRTGCSSTSCACRKPCLVLMNARSRLRMWSDRKNEKMNSEFTWSNVIVKRMSISIRNYKIISSSDLPFSNVFPLNKSDLSIFARNVLRGFHYISSSLKSTSVPFVQKSPNVHKSQNSQYKTKLHENKTIFLKM